jgi:hypothetical protein
MKMVGIHPGLLHLILLVLLLIPWSAFLAAVSTAAVSDRLPAPVGVESTEDGAKDNSELEITVIWEEVVEGSSYHVQVGEECGDGTIYIASGSSIALPRPVWPDTLHIRVRAVDEVGNPGAWSNCIEIPTDLGPPGQPGKPIPIF